MRGVGLRDHEGNARQTGSTEAQDGLAGAIGTSAPEAAVGGTHVEPAIGLQHEVAHRDAIAGEDGSGIEMPLAGQRRGMAQVGLLQCVLPVVAEGGDDAHTQDHGCFERKQ